MATADRSKKFEEWIREPTDDKIEYLVRLEKQVRILIHVFNLIGEVDAKAFHNLARLSHEIRKHYEESPSE